jgi:hypothetical protein
MLCLTCILQHLNQMWRLAPIIREIYVYEILTLVVQAAGIWFSTDACIFLVTEMAVICERLTHCLLFIVKRKSFGICTKSISSHSVHFGRYLAYNPVFFPSLSYAQLFSSIYCCYRRFWINMRATSANTQVPLFSPGKQQLLECVQIFL